MSEDINEWREKCFDKLRDDRGDREAARVCGVKAMTKVGETISVNDVNKRDLLLLVRKEPLNIDESIQAEIIKGNLQPVKTDSNLGKKIQNEAEIEKIPTPIVKTDSGFASPNQLEV